MTGVSVPQGTGGTLVERLTEALARHVVVMASRDTDKKLGICEFYLRCTCGWQSDEDDKPAHLADVAAQTVAAWVREREEAVAEATIKRRRVVPDSIAAMDCHLDADAALAALLDGIGDGR